MDYSKISTIELINFMSFKKAKVAFDETGIINIKGYNDSGKSAVLRGLVVCLMDMFKRNQVKFIRHGEEYFRVVVTFEDGVSILRDKYANGQSLYEVYKGGEVIFTTKQGNKLSKIDGVPQPIQDYLGLCVTDSVYLNYQSCVDRLPVVDTTGSENYQMFHEVLRMEEIYRANNMINTDKNELGSRIAEIEQSIQRDEVLLEKCGDVSQEFIDKIEELENQAKKTESRKTSLGVVSDAVGKYEGIPNIPTVEKVGVSRLREVNKIKENFEVFDQIKTLPQLEKVDSSRLEDLSVIGDSLKKLANMKVLPEVKPVDTSRRLKLDNVLKPFNTYAEKAKNCKEVDKKIKEARASLAKIMESASEKGIDFVKCENCGSYVVVGGEHSHD